MTIMNRSHSVRDLQMRAREISHRAVALIDSTSVRVGDLRQELHLASTWHLRRAAKTGSIDNLVYGHGSAEQALGALDIAPIAMLGFKAAGAVVYPWLFDAALKQPDGSFSDHVRVALEDPELFRFCVELGALHRWRWKKGVYWLEVVDFEQRPIARDPHARWRSRSITNKQRYLVAMVGECLAAADPLFVAPALNNRGEAHDWLLGVGGNPLFWRQPAPPIPPM